VYTIKVRGVYGMQSNQYQKAWDGLKDALEIATNKLPDGNAKKVAYLEVLFTMSTFELNAITKDHE
jgi:hypothetical protein